MIPLVCNTKQRESCLSQSKLHSQFPQHQIRKIGNGLMASHRIRREGNSPSAAPLKFFKILFNPRDNKIRLPKDFTTQLGRSFPSRVTLKTPNGSTWEAELIRSDGDTWIKKGWKEFKDYHSLDLGHMLVFEYDWISHFNVTIFGLTTLEIKYPVETETEGSETDDSVVFVKEKSTRQNEKGKGVVLEENDDHIEVDKKKSTAYERAEAFKSDKRFCIIPMHISYVARSFNLNVPFGFAKENLPAERNKVQLRVADGKRKIWTVICNFHNGISAKIAGGWKNFVKENKLRVGDVCVFEVKNRKKVEWKVIIFRR